MRLPLYFSGAFFSSFFKASTELNDANLLAYKEEVFNYIVYLGLPEVKGEPVLYDYYSVLCDSKIAEWAAKFTA